jgi:hypothetical protein
MTNTQEQILSQFDVAKKAGVPLVAINISDPATIIRNMRVAYVNQSIAQWDVINGVQSLTPLATDAVNKMNTLPDGTINPALATANPVEALMKIAKMPNGSIVFLHNIHMFMDKGTPGNTISAPVIQAIWNLRDIYKKTSSILVMLTPSFKAPDELQHDIVMMDEELPTNGELQTIITKAYSGTGLGKPKRAEIPKLIDATSGLAAFAVDQIVRMSVKPGVGKRKAKLDIEQLWKRKIDKIENSVGLKIHRTGPRFSDIGGNDNIKDLLRKISVSIQRPRLVVFLDEIEKSMQAAGTDTSGVTTDQLKVLLTSMQDYDWTGCICYGFPGTGKSELSKAFGHECGALTVEADLGAMKHIWVGSSEARMRQFVKTIKAMGGNKVFFMATCNHIDILRPELKRRFKYGIYFSDLPNRSELDVIWNIYLNKFNIPKQEKPNDNGWTGAEVRVCCERANLLNVSLKDACKFMTIVSHAMGEECRKMREAASGKYVSTQYPGVYNYKKEVSK